MLLSITPGHIEQVSEIRPKAGATLLNVKNKLDESLSSILILNTFAHTMGAAGVGSQAIRVFGAEWETLIAVLLTLAILYFSEIIPKTLGATFWRNLAVPTAYTIAVLVKLVFPLVWLSTRLTRLFSRDGGNEITRKEIIALASLGLKDGTLFSQENEYLSNILSLRDIRTEDVLTPRSVVYRLQESTSVSDALDQASTKLFSRIPVYGKDVDDITGKVIRRDLYEAERAGHGGDPISQHAREMLRVSEKLPVQQLIDFMIKQHVHLCLVEDEFGQTAGIVTLEDALETLLGREIVDESDQVVDMQLLAKDLYRERLRSNKQK